MNYPVVQNLKGGILHLSMDNPQNRNALSLAMMAGLQDAFERALDNDNIRVVILAANGPAFCAGHDMKELTTARTDADKGEAFFRKTMSNC